MNFFEASLLGWVTWVALYFNILIVTIHILEHVLFIEKKKRRGLCAFGVAALSIRKFIRTRGWKRWLNLAFPGPGKTKVSLTELKKRSFVSLRTIATKSRGEKKKRKEEIGTRSKKRRGFYLDSHRSCQWKKM